MDINLLSSSTIASTYNYNPGDVQVQGANISNSTVPHTYPGEDDRIVVEAWLLGRCWNERLQGTGGGGWQADKTVLSRFFMAGAIGDGYATTTTDAGLGNAVTPE
ncbi:hypothetical protein BBP40_003281 [Aspergillus hancockii]|nr:hypothetical protein BBP40_003281 [Aspergillus hancockii]